MGTAPTDDQIQEIEAALACGKSVTDACRSAGLDRVRFYAEIAKPGELATRIARAREIGIDARMDDCSEIADAATSEDWQVARLRIWERQWMAARIKPKKYGERTQLEHTGAEGGPLIIKWADAPKEGK